MDLTIFTHSVSHSYRLTKSHSEWSLCHLRKTLQNTRSRSMIDHWNRPRSIDPEKNPSHYTLVVFSGLHLCMIRASYSTSKLISSIPQQKLGQRAMVTASLGLIHRAVVSKIPTAIAKFAFISFYDFATNSRKVFIWNLALGCYIFIKLWNPNLQSHFRCL